MVTLVLDMTTLRQEIERALNQFLVKRKCEDAVAATLRALHAFLDGPVRAGSGDRELDDDGLRTAQKVIEETGAVTEVRQMIVTRRKRALDVLADAPFHPVGARALTDLALPGVRAW